MGRRQALVAIAVVALSGCDRCGGGAAPRVSDDSEREARADVGVDGGGEAPRSGAPRVGRRDVSAFASDALRAAIGDLDGDGRNEIVLADARTLRVVTPDGEARASANAPGGVQVLRVADLDGDGRAEILAGFGRTRDRYDAAARASIFRLGPDGLDEEVVASPETERPELVALLPLATESGPGLLVAYFSSRYSVDAAVARRGPEGVRLEPLATVRMAMSWAVGDVDGDGRDDIVVGRVYGDAQGADGDAFVLRPDGEREPIPTVRGVRGLAVADTNGDGRAEVFLGDGWHQNYAQIARALVTWARHGEDGFRAEAVDELAGQTSAWQIEVADVDGDGRPELVVRTGREVRLYRRAGDRWTGSTLAGEARDVAVGDLDGRPGAEVLVIGRRSEIVSLEAAASGAVGAGEDPGAASVSAPGRDSGGSR